MCSGTRSVGSRTIPRGKSPISSILRRVRAAAYHALRGCRASEMAPARRVSRRGGAPGRRPNRERRPLPGDAGEPSVRRALAARPAPPCQRGARRAAARRHHPRAANQDERDEFMSEVSDSTTLTEKIRDVIENEPVALFMKGTPRFVMCGNSDRALRALREAGAPVTAVDILPDPSIRQELSSLSGWPTIPQVFVKGELVGGADITEG